MRKTSGFLGSHPSLAGAVERDGDCSCRPAGAHDEPPGRQSGAGLLATGGRDYGVHLSVRWGRRAAALQRHLPDGWRGRGVRRGHERYRARSPHDCAGYPAGVVRRKPNFRDGSTRSVEPAAKHRGEKQWTGQAPCPLAVGDAFARAQRARVCGLLLVYPEGSVDRQSADAGATPRLALCIKWPYAFDWGARVRMRGGRGRLGQVTPPA
jgi:hypothetical protein